jgi:RNA-directed DNA polymerase
VGSQQASGTRRSLVNTGASWPSAELAEQRVLAMQTKLHRWAVREPGRLFDDLYNLVYDPAFLVVAWNRVRSNRGARTAGVDGIAPKAVTDVFGLLEALREDLKARRFQPDRVREVKIPKRNGKVRRLGIATCADRVVQAVLKLVLEPIFEADFKPCSYGFRPKRRAQDAIAEINYLGTPTRNYEWVFEADISACFDEISHSFLLERMRSRIGDRRLMALVKAFLKAGVLSEDQVNRDTITGTPQGGILSPCLANIALAVLDEHFTRKWEELGPDWKRAKLRRQGVPAHKIIRYADDFVIMTWGARKDAEALWDEISMVLAPIGLRLSAEKTRVCHIDEGFDFLGWRIQRRSWRGRPGKKAVYTYPSKKALASVVEKVRSLTRRNKHRTLAALLRRLNPVLRGWCTYFHHGVSSRTFSYLDYFATWRVVGWLRKRHDGLNWGTFRHRHLPDWEIRDGTVKMFHPRRVAIERYRYRGTRIATPWTSIA